MAANGPTDPFQQEIIALFAAEAQEWLSQIETALHELEAGPPQFRCAKLFETIRNGITNLGGSAATVECPDIEQLAFAMLPHLAALEGQRRVSSAGQCAQLREALETLALAIQRLIPSAAPPSTTAGPLAAAVPAGASAPSALDGATPIPLTGPIVDALRELQQSRAESAETTKALVESLLHEPVGSSAQEVVTGDRDAIIRNLKELEALDMQLLTDVQQRLPNIQQAVACLKAGGPAALASNGRLEGVLQDVARLRDEAFLSGASSVMAFFRGLHSWFSLVGRQQVVVSPQRVDAVESRLQMVLTMTQQWVDIGRMKKANIEQFLGL
jgi:chemotaxis protein histidine kinase CheA